MRTPLLPLFIALAAVLAARPAVAHPVAPADPWASPNLLVNRARLDEIEQRRQAGDAVFVAAWDQAVAEARSRLSDSPDPIVGALKIPGFYRQPQQQQMIARRIRRDAISAYSLAMGAALTGDAALAAKAKEFVLAWVDRCTHPLDGGQPWQVITWEHRGDTPLVIAYTFPQFIGAVDLLKGMGALDPAEVARFEAWLRVFVRYHEREELSKNNHLSWQVVFLLSAGHILNDRPLFEKAIRYYRSGLRFQVIGTGALPFELIRGEKAATYSLMALEAMTQAVFLAEMHGYTDLRDRKSWWGGDLHDAVGFLVKFLEDPASWRRYTGNRTLNGPATPAEWGWFLELPNLWWDDPRYARLLGQRPYGVNPPRAYTLSHATLNFAK